MVKLIAMDLDGTLLTSDKKLTSRTQSVLTRAADMGIVIVPATGRLYSAIPNSISGLQFIRYVISINGAYVYDRKEKCALYTAEIPVQRAVEIISYLDTLSVNYDCYMENAGWMTESMWERISEFAPDVHCLNLLKDTRKPVPNLQKFLIQQEKPVQKIQFFTKDINRRNELLMEIHAMFPDILATSSIVNNVEINARDANKGRALRELADTIGIGQEDVMAFGDGLNDISMLEWAGIGVAMGNGCEAARSVADYVTRTCDEDGVAEAIEKFCF